MSTRDFPSLGAKGMESSGNGPNLRPQGMASSDQGFPVSEVTVTLPKF